jgi:hypothetical protein
MQYVAFEHFSSLNRRESFTTEAEHLIIMTGQYGYKRYIL